MSTVSKSYASLSFKQTLEVIRSIGAKVTVLVEGEMGSGKSSLLPELAKDFPNHTPCYVEVACMDVGDVAVPKIMTLDNVVIGELVTKGEVTRFVPNEAFGLHLGKPLLILWDELGKATQPVVNSISRFINEGKLGQFTLPGGSIQFATTNLAVEGVGDRLQPHIRDRMCRIRMRKSRSVEWVENYAIPAGLDPIIIGFAMEYPQAFESFEDVEDPNSNPYIFHPKQPRLNFVTARSLTKASHILQSTEHLPDDVRIHALMGMVGEAAAMNVMTLNRLNEDIPAYERVLADPDNCPLPKSGVSSVMMVAKMAMRVEDDTMSKCMTYVERLPKETQALFARTLTRSPKRKVAASNRAYIEWASKNMYLFQ